MSSAAAMTRRRVCSLTRSLPLSAFDAVARDTPARAATAVRDSVPVVLFFGTSLTAGLGLEPEEAYPALIHCFTASADFAERVLALGLTISLSGIVTFKNAKDLQEVAKVIPDNKLLVETDSPFLAPVPHRGRVCEPAYVADTAAFVAGLRGTDVEHLKTATTANFFNLFSKATL